MMFSAEVPKLDTYKPPKNSKRTRPIHAFRESDTGDLYFDVPFLYDFMHIFRQSVPEMHRDWDDEMELWGVDQVYALPTEDLLEAFFPDIVIDYQGWQGE